jgi:type II secretory pathway pseudopilin PulG
MKKNADNIKRGQAAVELAIFGTLILLVFSVLLMYGQRLDSQQQVKMEAFRRALQKAYERNGSVSYTLKKESRAFNLFSGFGQGQPATVGSSASVLWQKGMSGNQGSDKAESFAYYAINDNEIGSKGDGTGLPRYPKQQWTATGGQMLVYVPVSVWSEEQIRKEEYSGTMKKEESPTGGIINTRTSDLKDTVNVTLDTRIDNSTDKDLWDNTVPPPEYVYEGETYEVEGEDRQVEGIGTASLGAYSRDDINRIDYSTDKVGTTIHRERSWQSDN